MGFEPMPAYADYDLNVAPWTARPKVPIRWRIRVSIPVPRACKARTLPIELIPHI